MLRAAGFCSLMDWRSLGVVWWMVPFWWFALAWSWRSFCGVVSLVCYFFGCFDRCLLLVLPVYNSPSFGLGCIAPWFVLLGPSLWWWLMLRVAPKYSRQYSSSHRTPEGYSTTQHTLLLPLQLNQWLPTDQQMFSALRYDLQHSLHLPS
ncbi:hypothetical protein O6H91_01G176000 [Diphasiastrum complanatum]|uniref:Uncharacterized protein n=1 Tax=Diphasiastrum complanatum TaxID=34168 RepID=A0ACC2EZ86_DIPCM|nr:hypothetical protein O6H91_01G176000 [Diphasiastrum complanatum]